MRNRIVCSRAKNPPLCADTSKGPKHNTQETTRGSVFNNACTRQQRVPGTTSVEQPKDGRVRRLIATQTTRKPSGGQHATTDRQPSHTLELYEVLGCASDRGCEPKQHDCRIGVGCTHITCATSSNLESRQTVATAHGQHRCASATQRSGAHPMSAGMAQHEEIAAMAGRACPEPQARGEKGPTIP